MKSIFVSSTFLDFNYERDVLRTRVMPNINRTAGEYGEFINFCDLRWGIDTTDEYEDAAGKVLAVCLDEIDRSRPYMIVLLGERYGYMPGKDVIEREAIRRKLSLADLEISVTQMEIEYGALKDTEALKHTFFYFREIPDLADSAVSNECTEGSEEYYFKLNALKQRIMEQVGDRVRFYKVGAESENPFREFCDLVTEDLKQEFLDEWKKESYMGYYERDNHIQWKYLREKASCFKTGYDFSSRVIEKMEQGDEQDGVIVIKGPAGAGKTTQFSYICSKLKGRGWDVIPFFCGITALSTDEDEILKALVWELESLTGVPHLSQEEKGEDIEVRYGQREEFRVADYGVHKEKQEFEVKRYQKRLEELCYIYEKSGRCLLVGIDAWEQMAGILEINKAHFIPEHLPANIRFLVTAQKDVIHPSSIEPLFIPALSEQDKHLVVQGILSEKGKQLSGLVEKKLLEKAAASNPLFLYMGVSRLCLMDASDYFSINRKGGQMDAINDRQIELIEGLSDDLEMVSVELLSRIADLIGENRVKRYLKFMAVSRHGLRNSDFEQLTLLEGENFIPLHLAQMINYLNELFILRSDGRYDFLHMSLRNGILNRITDKKEIHHYLADYLLGLPENDPVRGQEVTYHLIQSDNKPGFLKFIASLEIEKPGPKNVIDDIYYQCMEDQGVWILDIAEEYLAMAGYIDKTCNTLFYFMDHVSTKFYETKNGLEVYYNIVRGLVRIIEKEYAGWRKYYDSDAEICKEKCIFTGEEIQSFHNHLNHILCMGYEQIGKALVFYGTEKDLYEAELFFKEEIKLRKKQVTSFPNVINGMELAIAYENYGDLLYNTGHADTRKQALEIYQEALGLEAEVVRLDPTEIHRRNLTLMLSRVGGAYVDTGTEDAIKKGLEFYLRAEHMLRKLSEEFPTPENLYELSGMLCHLCYAYGCIEDREYFRKGVELGKEAVRIRRELYLELHTAKSMDYLIDAYLELGNGYSRMDGQEALEYALSCYEKAFKLAKTAVQDRGLSANYRRLVVAGDYLAKVSMELGGEANLNKALRFSREGHEMADFYADSMNTPKSILMAARAGMTEGEVYQRLGGREHLKKALSLYEESLQWIRKLRDIHYSSEEAGWEHSGILGRIGNVYEYLGGPDDLKEALVFYKKALDITKENKRVYGDSPERFRNIEVCYHNIGRIHLVLSKPGTMNDVYSNLQKGLQIAQMLADTYCTDKYLSDLSFSCKLNGEACLKEGTPGKINEAKKLFEKSLQIRTELCDRKKTLESKRALMLIYDDSISAFLAAGTYSDFAAAAEYAGKQCLLAETLAKESGTRESWLDLASCYRKTAKYYLRMGSQYFEIKAAEDYFFKCSHLLESLISANKTYRFFTELIAAYRDMAQLYIRMKQLEKAEEFYEKAIKTAKNFLQTDSDDEAQLLLPDLYMEIIRLYENRTEPEYLEKRADMIEECAIVYEKLYARTQEPQYLGNMASIYYTAGEINLEAGNEAKAAMYFEKNISTTNALDDSEKSQQRIICQYASSRRIAEIYVRCSRIADPETVIQYYQNTVKMEKDALYSIKEIDFMREIATDFQYDCSIAIQFCVSVKDYDSALHFYNEEIDGLLFVWRILDEVEIPLMQICLKCIEILVREKNASKETLPYIYLASQIAEKHPEYSELNNHLKMFLNMFEISDSSEEAKEGITDYERAMALYESAERCIERRDLENAEVYFKQSLELMKGLEDSERTIQSIIYEYNAFSQLAAIYANRNTMDSYRQAVHYYEQAIELELAAIETIKVEENDRQTEMMNDLQDDCMHITMLYEKLESYSDAQRYFEIAMDVSKRLMEKQPDHFGAAYAKVCLNYAAFKVRRQDDPEGVQKLLLEIAFLGLKYPELMEEIQNMAEILKKYSED